MLEFVPNTSFTESIRKIKHEGLSLVEIQKRLEIECPGADINFEDVCREMLEQSRPDTASTTQSAQTMQTKNMTEDPFFHQLQGIDELRRPKSRI